MRDFHAVASIFPLMEGADFAALVADVHEFGLREPIVLEPGGKVIDGRNRYRACKIAGVEPHFETYAGDNLIAYVVSLNLKRRHLDEGQRAMVASRLANLGEGRPSKTASIEAVSQEAAADLLNVSRSAVQRAAKVLDVGAAELVAAVDGGRVSVSTAADIATKPQTEQREIVARGEREILEAAKQIRAEKAEQKRTERLGALATLSERNAPLPVSERKYAVIYADPPWSFEVWSGAGKDRAAENHYPTMTQEQIEALPVASLAADDCALFLWAVMPQLPEALRVIEAWGFEYKTCAFVWVKQTKDEERFATGMGYWTRANAEVCLLATRGSPQRLNADVHQVVLAPREQHSRKPDEIAARIERLVPGPYLEMFARRERSGWDAWGNQASTEAA